MSCAPRIHERINWQRLALAALFSAAAATLPRAGTSGSDGTTAASDHATDHGSSSDASSSSSGSKEDEVDQIDEYVFQTLGLAHLMPASSSSSSSSSSAADANAAGAAKSTSSAAAATATSAAAASSASVSVSTAAGPSISRMRARGYSVDSAPTLAASRSSFSSSSASSSALCASTLKFPNDPIASARAELAANIQSPTAATSHQQSHLATFRPSSSSSSSSSSSASASLLWNEGAAEARDYAAFAARVQRRVRSKYAAQTTLNQNAAHAARHPTAHQQQQQQQQQNGGVASGGGLGGGGLGGGLAAAVAIDWSWETELALDELTRQSVRADFGTGDDDEDDGNNADSVYDSGNGQSSSSSVPLAMQRISIYASDAVYLQTLYRMLAQQRRQITSLEAQVRARAERWQTQ